MDDIYVEEEIVKSEETAIDCDSKQDLSLPSFTGAIDALAPPADDSPNADEGCDFEDEDSKVNIDRLKEELEESLNNQEERDPSTESSSSSKVKDKKKEKSKKELEEEEREKMQVLVSNFTEDQLNHYEMFRRAAFPKAAIKRLRCVDDIGLYVKMSDQEFNVKLVGEVKKHEVLYNYTLPGYSRKDVTEKAWQLVAAKMNTSAADCKEKWRNLRTVFLRKLKPPKSGSGATRKAYYLENAMQFCLPFLKTSAPPSSGNWPPAPLSSTGDDVGVGDPENFDDVLETQAYPSRPLDPSSASHFLSSNSPFRPNEDSIAQQSQLPILPARPIRSEKESALRTPAAQDASVAENFAAKRARLEATEAEGGHSRRIDRQQSLKMYLLSLMPELLELSDSQIKLFKRRVFTLIEDISKD